MIIKLHFNRFGKLELTNFTFIFIDKLNYEIYEKIKIAN